MTPKQDRALRRFLETAATELGLVGWVFHIHDEPCGEGHAAEVSTVYGRRIATISLASNFWEMHAGERHHVLVHELIHIVNSPLQTYLDETLPTLVGAGAWTAMSEAIRQYEEHAVDQLASALAPHLPVLEDA